MFCEQSGYRRDECPELARLEKEGRCHRNGYRIIPRPIGFGNRPIFFRDSIGSKLQQVEQETKGYRTESSAAPKV